MKLSATMNPLDSDTLRPDAVIDIIMRTRGRMSLLPRAIASVRAQTFRDWRLIIIDSGDHASTRRWLDENPGAVGERVEILAASPHHAMGGLSNLGVRHGRAPLVVLLDDDDTWEPGFLAATCPVLLSADKRVSCRGVVTRSTIIHEEKTGDAWIETGRELLNPKMSRITLPALASCNRFTTNAFVYERAAWEELGGYHPEMPVLDDWDFNLRFLWRWDIACIPEALAFWHRRPVTGGPTDNSLAMDHEGEAAAYINHHLRQDPASPLAPLLAMGDLHRLAMEHQSRLLGKLKSMSDKVGKIESRTRRQSPR